MGERGRKRKAMRQARNRTGLIKSLTGMHSQNQIIKRRLQIKADNSFFGRMIKMTGLK